MIIKYFGNKFDSVDREILQNYKDEFDWQKLENFKSNLGYKNLVLLNQTHSVIGFIVDQNNINNFLANSIEGDYIITNLPGIALGVYTADCLPIIFYDNKNKVVAIVHAGWPGSVNKIALKTLQDMQNNFGSKIEDLEIYFGPSAKKCCYEVSQDFKNNLKDYTFADQVLIESEDKIFFDLPKFNILLLETLGLTKKQINLENNICTICDDNFCSYRRNKTKNRQLNIVILK